LDSRPPEPAIPRSHSRIAAVPRNLPDVGSEAIHEPCLGTAQRRHFQWSRSNGSFRRAGGRPGIRGPNARREVCNRDIERRPSRRPLVPPSVKIGDSQRFAARWVTSPRGPRRQPRTLWSLPTQLSERDGRWTASAGPASERQVRLRRLAMTQLPQRRRIPSRDGLGRKAFAGAPMPEAMPGKVTSTLRRGRACCRRAVHRFRLWAHPEIWLLHSCSGKPRHTGLWGPLTPDAPWLLHSPIRGKPHRC